MGETEKDANASPLKIKKKSKKIKNMSNDQLDVGDDNRHVEIGNDVPNKKDRKHKEKKRKSATNEEQGGYHGNLEETEHDSHKKDKKRKRGSSENNHCSENTQTKENKSALEQESDLKPEKVKKRKHKHNNQETEIQEDMFKKVDKKKKKKEKTDIQHSDAEMKENTTEESDKVDSASKDGSNKKKKKTDMNENAIKDSGKEDSASKDGSCIKGKKKKPKSQHSEAEMNENTIKDSGKQDSASKDGSKKEKKKKTKIQHSEAEMNTIKEKKTKSVENKSEKPKSKGKSKRVSFSGQVEVFPCSDSEPDPQKSKKDGLIRGKRFTPEEDEIVKEAVHNYITARGLGEEGLKMVLNCRSHAGMKKCWQEIGTCIPYRPYSAVYYRAHILFERAETRVWTPEEIKLLKEYHEKHGNNWKALADELGKHRFHVKDTWRRIKLKEMKSGRWSQEEYQNLYDLVNKDLQTKASAEMKQSKYGMLRDNIPWTAISEKLTTRSDANCCIKWYNQLTSSLVAEKKWADADDYRLIGALYELDAACEDDVDWDKLLEHRSGDVCLKRWRQMVRHIGHHGSEPFAAQVDTLAKRYCPDLAETREAWDNKPVV